MFYKSIYYPYKWELFCNRHNLISFHLPSLHFQRCKGTKNIYAKQAFP